MTTDIYTIRTLTNLHAGSGDANYGIIDKQVQRDPLDNTPVIHSSSLKGAFREYKETELGETHPDVIEIFGNTPKNNTTKSIPGNYYFFEARLLSLPVRSSTKPFFRATSLETIDAFVQQLEAFGLSDLANSFALKEEIKVKQGEPKILKTENDKVDLEDLEAAQDLSISAAAALKKLIGDNVALFHNDDFKELCQGLPVIARNHLDDGISKNLWYEEVVPRETVFYFAVRHPDADKLAFAEKIVQIGGNATIGYGFCELKKL